MVASQRVKPELEFESHFYRKQKHPDQKAWALLLAERVRFELTVLLHTLVFKTSTINHSVISPDDLIVSKNYRGGN